MNDHNVLPASQTLRSSSCCQLITGFCTF
uniref:Uncharacterized protein n=1 Tax=Rhizophora mucronata TaxID=61149 RepID=A0A2P2QG55_RHIMU